jgi:hypothetical protein
VIVNKAIPFIMLQELEWDLTPITCVSWVTVFLQTLAASTDTHQSNSQFMTPQFSQHGFIQVMRVRHKSSSSDIAFTSGM